MFVSFFRILDDTSQRQQRRRRFEEEIIGWICENYHKPTHTHGRKRYYTCYGPSIKYFNGFVANSTHNDRMLSVVCEAEESTRILEDANNTKHKTTQQYIYLPFGLRSGVNLSSSVRKVYTGHTCPDIYFTLNCCVSSHFYILLLQLHCISSLPLLSIIISHKIFECDENNLWNHLCVCLCVKWQHGVIRRNGGGGCNDK